MRDRKGGEGDEPERPHNGAVGKELKSIWASARQMSNPGDAGSDN